MHCSAFARQDTWCARVHFFARPHHSRLSEMSSFTLYWHRASTTRELRTRDHRNGVTGQSPRHGDSRMKQAVRTDARDFGATPPLSAYMSIRPRFFLFYVPEPYRLEAHSHKSVRHKASRRGHFAGATPTDCTERLPRAVFIAGRGVRCETRFPQWLYMVEPCARCWGYTHGLLRTFAQSRSHGPAKRPLRSMVPKVALH